MTKTRQNAKISLAKISSIKVKWNINILQEVQQETPAEQPMDFDDVDPFAPRPKIRRDEGDKLELLQTTMQQHKPDKEVVSKSKWKKQILYV